MAKRVPTIIDYSKSTLSEIIEKETGRETDFLELDSNEKCRILRCLEEHNVNIKVLGYKWYDILSNKFFAVKYQLDGREVRGFREDKIELDQFEELFRYVEGDVYHNACFYGYSFSEKEISEYSLDLHQINFDSLINETIEMYTFESIKGIDKEETAGAVLRASEIAQWFKKARAVSTLKSLEAKYKEFIDKFNFFEARAIFFSIYLRKHKDAVKKAAIEFACKHDYSDGLEFEKIFQTYGKDAAQYVIDHFDGGLRRRMIQKRKCNYKDELAGLESGTCIFLRELGFDKYLQLYYVKDGYYSRRYRPSVVHDYFTDFSEFASYVNGDLSDADLSEAPVSKQEVEKYKTNEYTRFPFSKKYSHYEVTKEFTDGKFIVTQRWLDFDGSIILEKQHQFTRFFDFAHFLKDDLSGADLLLCDGIENIYKMPGLKLDGIKVRSVAAEKLGLSLQLLPEGSLKVKEFEQTSKLELTTVDSSLMKHPEDQDYSNLVRYVSDIHLLHRYQAYQCKTVGDVEYVTRTITKTLAKDSYGVNLIGGDTSSNFEVFKEFVKDLAGELSAYKKNGDFFFTLGNHELWGLNGESLPSIVEQYKAVLEQEGEGNMHLVQNNIFYADGGWKEITEEELSKISPEDLRAKLKSAFVIIFGGIGFAGKNNEFNANNGIYLNVLDREGEIRESEKFLFLYQKVATALKGRSFIVLTHMPMKDWGGEDIHPQDGVVYVSGHNHRNYFYDDGRKRIYADNQVGYKGKNVAFKEFAIDFSYEWFADYKDGIYEISREDYERFYRGTTWLQLTFKRKFNKLFMIKREKTYMFLMQTPKGTLVILNGGAIRKAGNHSLEYFYENIVKYSESVKLFLAKYNAYQKRVSDDIKRFGGEGTIHGCIVDIDFYNHLYVNIRDGTITPYYALSMVDKTVYENLPSLLNVHCPQLFYNYKKLIEQQSGENALTVFNEREPIVKDRYWDDSTEIYRDSRIVNGLQYTTRYNIVRLWNDVFVEGASEENGKMIVLGIMRPEVDAEPVEIECDKKSKKKS